MALWRFCLFDVLRNIAKQPSLLQAGRAAGFMVEFVGYERLFIVTLKWGWRVFLL